MGLMNTFWLVPTIMSILMEMDRGNKGIEYCKDNIILSMVGTDFLSTELREAFTQKYEIELHENYGLSETLFIATHSPKEKIPKASVGKIVSNVEVKIVDSPASSNSFLNSISSTDTATESSPRP